MRQLLSIFAFSVLSASAAQATDYLCTEISQTARAINGELTPVRVAASSKLKIRIDVKKPTNSSITWLNTGDAELDNQASKFTTGSRVVERDGQVFATMFAQLKTMTAVGTLLIGRTGDLWITESTAADDKIAHYIIQGRCEQQ